MRNISIIFLKIVATILLILLAIGIILIGFLFSETLILKYFILAMLLMFIAGFLGMLPIYIWKGREAWVSSFKEFGKAPK